MTPTTPTQIQYPFRAALRTVVALILSTLTAYLLGTIPGLGQILQDFGPSFVDPITNGAVLLLTGVWTWIMARPKVNEFLTAIGLGARPKSVETL